jgi:polysaccharide biosynthesis transport protein
MYQSENPAARDLALPMPGPQAPSVAAGPPVFDMPAAVATLWRRRSWIVGTVGLVLATTLALLVLRTHTYTAATRILIDPRGYQVVEKDLTPTNQSGENNAAHVENQMRVLTSDWVLRQVVEREQLAADPEFGRKPPSLLRRLRAMVQAMFGLLEETANPEAAALRQLRRIAWAERQRDSHVVDLFVSTRDAQKSARIANAVAAIYVQSEQTARNDAAQRVSQSLAGRAEELRQRVQLAERRVEEYRRANDILDIGSAATAGSEVRLLSQDQLSQMNQQVSLAKARTSQAQARFDQIERLRAEGAGYSAFADAVQSATITQLRTRYSAAREIEASFATTLGPQHPRLAAAKAQVRDVENAINEELDRIARSARGDLERARSDEADLVTRLENLKRASVMTNQAQVQLRELEREAGASRSVYESFLVRAREISEQKGLDTSSERILSPAVPPVDADGPRSLFVLAFAAILALGLGSVLALVRDQFDDRLRSPSQLTALTGLRILTTVTDLAVPAGTGHAAPTDIHALLCTEGLPAVVYHRHRSEGATAFRRLDAALRHTASAISLRTILVTSAGSDDGKSTVALNLALAALDAGDRVLLADADAIKQSLTAAARIPEATAPGTTYTIIPGAGPGALSLATPTSLGIAGSGQGWTTRSIVIRLAAEFDTVIIDGSTLEDSSNLAQLADVSSDIVLVARAHATVGTALASAIQVLGPARHKIRGAVYLDV